MEESVWKKKKEGRNKRGDRRSVKEAGEFPHCAAVLCYNGRGVLEREREREGERLKSSGTSRHCTAGGSVLRAEVKGVKSTLRCLAACPNR